MDAGASSYRGPRSGRASEMVSRAQERQAGANQTNGFGLKERSFLVERKQPPHGESEALGGWREAEPEEGRTGKAPNSLLKIRHL